ncbi:DUF1326 domain-containing protein [Mesorhizobium sp. M0924]|uniref:DUF1326 domain-containing protein n=1 Tax=unclassified Mesorhizobium TaxID=325217 RepID=UPI00333B2E6A
MNAVPQWRLAGDWFDICSCDIPCPCEFAQRPTGNHCQGVLAWHVREGQYGGVKLDGLTLVALGEFEGNLWAGEAKAVMGMYLDEKADEQQREALQVIFGGNAGGWPAGFAANVGEMRGMEFVPITFEVAGDLATWRVEILTSSLGAQRRFPAPPHHLASGCRRSTRRARRSARARLPPGDVLSR